MKVAAAIITHNDARALERCLASLSWCDEIVVMDQHSEDDTAAVCARFGARLEQTTWAGFGVTKQRACDACQSRWVLSVDTDEVVTPELRDAILALPDAPAEAAFAINRLSCFLGRWIHHCGWHPDWVVRLFDRERARFDDRAVHEQIHSEGRPGRVPGLLHHHAYETMEQYIAKLNRYTTAAAEELHGEGRRCGLPLAVVRAQATFWRMWILQGGILDGWPGTALCLASSFYVLAKYTKLWRMGE